MVESKEQMPFAPPERAHPGEVRAQVAVLTESPLLGKLFDALNEMVIILNEQRQIVFWNRAAARVLETGQEADIRGLRPGEALRCVRSDETPAGCGTSEFCSTCGAVHSILEAQQGKEATRECRILRQEGLDVLNLLVRTTPFKLNGERFVICALRDISDRKRRAMLERTFFHDLMNCALGLQLHCRMAERGAIPPEEALNRLMDGVNQLLEEIGAQRDLAAAEKSDLAVRTERFAARELLESVAARHRHNAQTSRCRVAVDPASQDIGLETDRALLGRVLDNVVINAIEASDPGQTVTLGCRLIGERVQFRVHNETAMPRDVQFQVFQPSFTTKGPGRGLGTYSMKLLSERYLQGSVSFESSPAEGTTFYATYPLSLAD